MEKQVEIEKGKANNFEMLFSALRKDVVNVLDFMERLKNEEDQNAVDVYLIERLRLELAFICTYVQLSYSDLEQFEVVMSYSRQRVDNLLRPILNDMDRVLPNLMGNIDDCISSCYRSTSSATMTDEQLNFLLLNLHHLSKYLAERIFPLETHHEILQNVSCNMKDFHGLIVNGCIEHEIVQYVLPQFQVMAERMMQICYTNLKASPSEEIERFINQLLETSPEVLREYLIHLQEHMVTVITVSTSGARSIHVMIEFLLIILTDMPKEIIHHDKLFDLLARVGALIREVSTLVHDLEEKSRNEESTDEKSRATLDLLENIELLKEDLEHVYLKAPDSSQWCFPMSDGPLFMHLLHRHLNDLLYSNAYSIALIKEEIGLVKEDLEFIRSFFGNVEKGLYKDLWAHALCEDVSNLLEKIPKNKSLVVVNAPKNPLERRSLTSGKIIVGFKEETNWLITKLTSGPKDLDVISITGMPGSGKTTLAYKVYNDKSVCSHFDLRAWCTVDQEYDEKNLLVKLFNQVTGSDLKFSEDIDVADKLRRQLFGKRYLIVLDDVWDTTVWDDLTRPFPEVEKGSRILLTTRQKEVALHGKRNTDPLKLRLLKLEESWELLEKRAFGNESCPDELLEVGKEIAQNCKGLPLVVDLIAGVIAGLEKTKSVWLEVRNNLNSFILKSEVDVMEVIELSYDHLPHHIKPCFLYLASYPKDIEINRDLLKMYWHAEEFRRSDNPTCQLHDLVHDFCLIKAREEKLFGEISSSDASSSSDLMPRIENIVYNKEQFELNNFVLFSSKKKRHSGKHLYSLLITGEEMEDRLSDACHLRDLRLLRSMLNVTGFSFFDMDTDEPILIAEDSKLENLRELGKLVLPYSKETEDIFKRFPNLQVLSFVLQGIMGLFNREILVPEFGFPKQTRFPQIVPYENNHPGEEWNMGEEDTFENLKYLCFEEVTLAKWDLGEESFTVLEKLALWECHKLEEIPPSFGNISSLKFIELYKSPQLEHSALKIKQYVDDMTGGDTLKVEISRAPTEQVLLHYDSFSRNCRSAKRCPHRTRSLMKLPCELEMKGRRSYFGKKEKWRKERRKRTTHRSSFILSSPPAAMPCTVTFLPPKAGDFNCTEVIEKFLCNKKWALCLQGVIIVTQAGGIIH
ncbi:hypothetical protein P3S68_015154 [Capsicum galapagoense]